MSSSLSPSSLPSGLSPTGASQAVPRLCHAICGPQDCVCDVARRWGEPVLAFVVCLAQHAADHEDRDCVYWVCAYANNQWKLDEELVDDLKQTSFRKALDRAEGTVTVLDSGSVTFTRVWCCYEIFVSLEESADKLCTRRCSKRGPPL